MVPQLHTQRYLLQQIRPEDQSFIYQGLSDPQVIPYYGVHFTSFEATASQMEFYERLWRERTGCWWKIVDKETGMRVGACGMNAYQPQHEKAEIGYWLLPDFWKKGIMPEVLPVMIRYVFNNWKLHRLEAVVEQGNDPSCRLCEKLGFQLEGVLRESEVKGGRRINLLMYSLLASDSLSYDSSH
jgi:[ribosomal protein S5]-alanine N-acetyltransferase